MALSEFTLINQFFNTHFSSVLPANLGIGDDCALLSVPNQQQLAISTDTSVEGTHFLADSDPYYLGCKSLAVNLSDLAAMGAKPAWLTLSLTLPEANENWLKAFSEGFLSSVRQHSMQLIGGDTTQGPLAISVTVMGLLPEGAALKRSGANVGDGVYVSGSIGSAGLGLLKAKQGLSDMSDNELARYIQPIAQVALGEQLLPIATSCIDVSDGLSADLNHILNASGVGARIEHEKLPITEPVKNYISLQNDLYWPYSSGDDYELCFTLPKELEGNKQVSEWVSDNTIAKIGVIEEKLGLRIVTPDGLEKTLDRGYRHFDGK